MIINKIIYHFDNPPTAELYVLDIASACLLLKTVTVTGYPSVLRHDV